MAKSESVFPPINARLGNLVARENLAIVEDEPNTVLEAQAMEGTVGTMTEGDNVATERGLIESNTMLFQD